MRSGEAMRSSSLERVFGTTRLRMVTGQYAEVYREAAAPGERRRYTKRFLATKDGDFREWTEREWRTLARLVGHGARHVPEVIQYDRGAAGGDALVQTYDAGVTVDHWATLLPVQRGGRVQRHIFQDCAHWWALARHLLFALHEIHPLGLVHLDLKADNICIPLAPADFDPAAREQRLSAAFENIALIDFAFSVVTGETLKNPLPIGWQRTYRYQSPRLVQALIAGQNSDLEPTRQLDWRCDMFSLAALLEALLPPPPALDGSARNRGWTDALHAEAKALLLSIRQSHDRDVGGELPHLTLAAACTHELDRTELSGSLRDGWTLASGLAVDSAESSAMQTTAPLTRVRAIETAPIFSAVTEVLPRRQSGDIATAGHASLGPQAITQPVFDPGAAEPLLAPAPDPHALAPTPRKAVTDATSRRPAPSGDPASSATDISGPRERNGLRPPAARGPAPARSTSHDASSVKPAPGGRPPASARKPARGERPTALLVAATAAVVVAAAWWMTPHDASSPVDDRQSTGTLDARVGVAARVGKTSSSALPGTTTSPAPSGGEVPSAAPTMAAAPSLVEAEKPSVPVARPVPPATETARPPTVALGAAVPAEHIAPSARRRSPGVVPLVVANAEPRVAQVLSIAARARRSSDDRVTSAMAARIGDGVFERVGSVPAAGAPAQARRLNAAAQQAFYQLRNVARAYELQQQAFDADPTNVEIAGNLAFYALKIEPPRAEESRALAIYALALASRAGRPTRSEDWGSLAVASALSGRSSDARSAMLVLLAVSRDVNRSCHSALSSVASHGQAMRMPAEALLLRAQDRIDVDSATQCRWPVAWRQR